VTSEERIEVLERRLDGEASRNERLTVVLEALVPVIRALAGVDPASPPEPEPEPVAARPPCRALPSARRHRRARDGGLR